MICAWGPIASKVTFLLLNFFREHKLGGEPEERDRWREGEGEGEGEGERERGRGREGEGERTQAGERQREGGTEDLKRALH